MSEKVVLVTGMSGAGRTSVLKALEDIGYEAVDNLPLSLLGRLVEMPDAQSLFAENRALAIGVDLRTRDFAVDSIIDELERLTADDRLEVTSLFVDCDDAVLVRRYTETRRRHPLASDRPLPDTIRIERRLLARLRDRADLVVDTTDSTAAALKERLSVRFSLDGKAALHVFVTSFSFRHGVPREADLVFDVRFLRNPHYDTVLRDLTGEDPTVQTYIAEDVDFSDYIDSVKSMLRLSLPRYRSEGKSYLTIAVGCTGGRHRSVYVAKMLAEWLLSEDWPVRVQHRDIHREAGRDML